MAEQQRGKTEFPVQVRRQLPALVGVIQEVDELIASFEDLFAEDQMPALDFAEQMLELGVLTDLLALMDENMKEVSDELDHSYNRPTRSRRDRRKRDRDFASLMQSFLRAAHVSASGRPILLWARKALTSPLTLERYAQIWKTCFQEYWKLVAQGRISVAQMNNRFGVEDFIMHSKGIGDAATGSKPNENAVHGTNIFYLTRQIKSDLPKTPDSEAVQADFNKKADAIFNDLKYKEFELSNPRQIDTEVTVANGMNQHVGVFLSKYSNLGKELMTLLDLSFFFRRTAYSGMPYKKGAGDPLVIETALAISLIDGDITILDSSFLSFKEIFKLYGIEDRYPRFRCQVFNMVKAAIDQELIPEVDIYEKYLDEEEVAGEVQDAHEAVEETLELEAEPTEAPAEPAEPAPAEPVKTRKVHQKDRGMRWEEVLRVLTACNIELIDPSSGGSHYKIKSQWPDSERSMLQLVRPHGSSTECRSSLLRRKLRRMGVPRQMILDTLYAAA